MYRSIVDHRKEGSMTSAVRLIDHSLYLHTKIDSGTLHQLHLDRYEIESEVGHGHNATTFLVKHKVLQKDSVVRIGVADKGDRGRYE